jgi:hypothetical protein
LIIRTAWPKHNSRHAETNRTGGLVLGPPEPTPRPQLGFESLSGSPDDHHRSQCLLQTFLYGGVYPTKCKRPRSPHVLGASLVEFPCLCESSLAECHISSQNEPILLISWF